MPKRIAKRFLITIAYSSLLIGICAYIVMGMIMTNTYGSIDRLNPSLFTASWAAGIAVVAHIVVIVNYKGLARVLSVFGLLISLGLAALLVIPLGFAVG